MKYLKCLKKNPHQPRILYHRNYTSKINLNLRPVPIDRWMDIEDVAHIYNGIVLSHKKERNWVICWDVAGSRDCHAEWSKSEREKQILYINAYIWNLEKWYRWTGLQGRNWDTDAENKCMDTTGESGGGVRWWCDEFCNWDWHVYTDVYKIDD